MDDYDVRIPRLRVRKGRAGPDRGVGQGVRPTLIEWGGQKLILNIVGVQARIGQVGRAVDPDLVRRLRRGGRGAARRQRGDKHCCLSKSDHHLPF